MKNALIRYRIIDTALCDPYHPYPSKQDLRLACEEDLFGDSIGENICDSTIEKDFFAMRQEYDAPIQYSKSHKGYFYKDPDFTINEIPLSENDVNAIQFALSTLSQFKETAMFQQFGFALNKIIDHVNADSGTQESDVDQHIQFEKGNTAVGNEYLPPLLTAIKEQFVAYFSYESFVRQVRKPRKVTPLLLKEYNNRWYLISFDLVKEKVITYALDRISDLEVSDQHGEKPMQFDPDLFFKHSVGITASADSHPEKISFTASSIATRYINSQPFHQSQQMISTSSESSTFELFALVSEELIRAILSYAGEIEVTSPTSLREEIISRIQKMNGRYKLL